MNPETPLDLLHASLEGRLAPEDEALLEALLASDPRLARQAEDYRVVHALTSDERRPGEPRTRYEDLLPRLERAPRRLTFTRRVAAAAAVVLLCAGAFLAGRLSARAPHPVVLAAIELHPLPHVAPPRAAEVALSWASFDPRGAGEVRFLGDLDEAELLARCADRPLLVYGTYPGCPLAAALDETVFRDPRVVDLAERTVPIRIDLSQLSDVEQRALIARGYPFLEVWLPDGRPSHSLVRAPDAARFVESLHDGLARSEATGEMPPWEDLRRVAEAFEEARRDELAGDCAGAESGYLRLLEASDTPAELRGRASDGLRRLATEARQALMEARHLAGNDEARALERLDAARARFAGSSWGADLDAVRTVLANEGAFPVLIEREPSV
jgi:hypothetical protein